MGKKSRDKAVKKDEKPKKETPKIKKSERSIATKVGCVESFEWNSKEKPPSLPPMPSKNIIGNRNAAGLVPHVRQIRRTQMEVALRNGWDDYLGWRFGGNKALKDNMSQNVPLKDGLSSPIAILAGFVAYTKEVNPMTKDDSLEDAIASEDPLHIVVMGATSVNEEKILKETNYWDELGYVLSGRKIHLYLTGIEMSGSYVKQREAAGAGGGRDKGLDMVVECWKGKAVDFFLEKGRMEVFSREETITVAFNTGVGPATQQICKAPKADERANDVIWSWLPSLLLLAAADLPIFLTGGSLDDVKHVMYVMHNVVGSYNVLGAHKITTPFETFFEGGSEVVRANSFMCIVQGLRPGCDPFSSVPVFPDTRPANFSTLIRAAQALPPKHPKIAKALGRKNGRELVPLKRYGNYPPKAKPEAEAEAEMRRRAASGNSAGDRPDESAPSATAVDSAGEGRGGAVVAEREGKRWGGGSEGVAKAMLKQEVAVVSPSEGPDLVAVSLKNVFIVDPGLARVGVTRTRFVIFYHDCHRMEEVVYEGALPLDVDHATAKVIFRPSEALVKISVRVLGEN